MQGKKSKPKIVLSQRTVATGAQVRKAPRLNEWLRTERNALRLARYVLCVMFCLAVIARLFGYAESIRQLRELAARFSFSAAVAEAAPKPTDDDFGAETIEDDTPLPVDQVEQRDQSLQSNLGDRRKADQGASAVSENDSNAALRQRILGLLAQGESAWGAGAVAVPRDGILVGAKLFGVKPDSIFVTFGLKNGDIIKTLAGEPVSGPEDLRKILERVTERDTVVLEVEREGKEIVIPITTGPELANPDVGIEAGLPPDLELDTTTLLNVNDVEITALVKTFSKLTKRNYIVDSGVKGKITIHLPSAVSIPEALRILDAVLLLKGFTTVPVEKNTWKVVNAKDARQTTIPLVQADRDSPSDVMVTQMIKLKYIAAADIQQLLTQFVSKDGLINAFAGTNSLVLIDSQANIQRLQNLIRELDVPALDQEITIIPILYADAKDIAEKIESILGEKESSTPADPLQARRALIASNLRQPPGSPQAPDAAGGTSVERRALPLKIISDERTNSIVTVSDPEMTIKVRALVEQLDTKLDQSSGRFWVHRLQHADAEELSDVLNSLISGNTSGLSSRRDSRSSGSSISRSRNSAGSQFGDRNQQTSARGLSSRARDTARTGAAVNTALGGGASTGGDVGKVSLEGEVSIAPDVATNALIINASKGDYSRLKEVIDELDIRRRQVLVEATILEVSLDNERGLGVELQGTAGNDDGGLVGQTNFGGLTSLLTNPAALTDLTIAAASTGTLTLPGGLTIPSQAVLVSAVSRMTNVNVLSTPTILSTDNEEAEIIVGENVPFVSSTGTDTSNIQNTFNSIERQDVGITLRITPQISSGDFVVLKIFVEVSGVVERTRNDPNGPSTTINTTETTVTVKDKQMIVTGGLISDNQEDATRGVPFFEDIPVFGQLFKRSNSRDRRKNLLIFITPRVIDNQFDARENTRATADKAERLIEKLDLLPDRQDILRNNAIDDVTSATITDPTKGPTTITPPNDRGVVNLDFSDPASSSAKIRTEQRLKQLVESQPSGDTRAGPADTGEVIEFRVQPKLPNVGGSSQESSDPLSGRSGEASSDPPFAANLSDDTALSSSAQDVPLQGDSPLARFEAAPGETLEAGQPAARLAAPSMVGPAANIAGKTFVVLRQVRPKSADGLDGFQYADSERTLGLELVGGLDSQAGQFFQVGSTYTFDQSTDRNSFVCLGVYGSAAEASIVHPPLNDVNRWNGLSPSQTLSLGTTGWKRS